MLPTKYPAIIQGDNKDLIKEIPDETIDMIMTSPPYDDLRDYKGFTFDIDYLAHQCFRVLKPGGVIVYIIRDKRDNGESLTSFRHALLFQSVGFSVETMIWDKGGESLPHPNAYWHVFEYMFLFYKGFKKTVHLLRDKKNRFAGERKKAHIRQKNGEMLVREKIATIAPIGKRTDIWKISPQYGNTSENIAYQHPAIFPEELVRDHILSWSDPGDIVLDIFGGSGTTVKIANLLQRKGVMFEISKEYCEIARNRVCQKGIESFINKPTCPEALKGTNLSKDQELDFSL